MDSKSIESTAAGFRLGVEIEREAMVQRTIGPGTTDLTPDNGQEAQRGRSESGPPGGPPQAVVVTSSVEAKDEENSVARSQRAQTVAENLGAIYSRFVYGDEVEVGREMRFGLRLVVATLGDRILAGERESAVFQREVIVAVDPASTGVENIRLLAARVVHDAIGDVDWRLDAVGDDGGRLPAEEQPANIALRQILAGIREVNQQLTAILQGDGTDDVEFDEPVESDEDITAGNASNDDEAMAADPGTTTAPAQQRAAAGGPLGASQARPQRRGGERIRWTAAEDSILIQACTANLGAPLTTIANDHNRRMRIDRLSVGATVHRDRERSAIEARRKFLRKTNPGI